MGADVLAEAIDNRSPAAAIEEQAGKQNHRHARAAALERICEGLATVERSGMSVPFDADRVWCGGLSSLIAGFAAPSRARV